MRRFATAAVCAVMTVGVAACSSSGGGGGVSQSKLEAKLKSESDVKTLISQAGTTGQQTDALVGCLASALEKNAKASDLKAYVDGKKSLDDVAPKSKGSESNASSEAKSCVESTVKGASASASASS